jgi:hypothetical protein
MGPKCVVMASLLVLLTGATSAIANNPSGSDAAAAAKSSNVKNAPFSADVITQYDRTLDNGGHIHRESRGKVYRDSQDRMRTESQTSGLQPGSERSDHHITITDPLQQVVIYLNPKNKTATIFHFGDVGPAPVTTAKQSKPKDKAKIRIGGQPGIGGGPTDTLGVPQVPSGQGNAPSNGSIPARDSTTSRMDASVLANTAGATVVPLGTKTIEGGSATGSRTTRIMNPGTMGNDRPIVFISDTWTSTDLKVMVLTETDDGQAGHSTMKLVNIVRSEPNPALFQVPPDYTVNTVKENTSTASASH